jgi:spore germination cell wall hydrolase CwlJ-like protein
LDRFKETRKNVEDTKAKLEGEKAELDAYHAEVAEQQAMVTGYVNATTSEIGRYSKEIKNFEAVADAYAAKAAEEEENIAALKKQLAEEIAMSKLAAQSKWRDISEVSFEDGDRMLLANLIYCEAGNQPYEGQLAVGAVVINRVLSSVYPDTVVGVIYQYKQFSPVGDGHLALALAEDRATSACYKAADEAMSGQTNVGNCVYFRTPIEGLSGIQIGAHIFY